MFKKDSMIFGIVLAIVITVAGYFLLGYLNVVISAWFGRTPVFKESSIEVFSIFLNVFPFRYYMLKAHKEYTGRGILLVTFITGLTFFFHYLND